VPVVPGVPGDRAKQPDRSNSSRWPGLWRQLFSKDTLALDEEAQDMTVGSAIGRKPGIQWMTTQTRLGRKSFTL